MLQAAGRRTQSRSNSFRAAAASDFGNADLVLASKPGGDAETLVWQPILNWINDRAQ
jgi:hypothetical protein